MRDQGFAPMSVQHLLSRAVWRSEAAGPPILVHRRALYERQDLRRSGAARARGMHDNSVEALSAAVAIRAGLERLAAPHR